MVRAESLRLEFEPGPLPVSDLLKHLRQVDLSELLACELHGKPVGESFAPGAAFEAPDLDRAGRRIDDPVLGDALTAIQLEFDPAVPSFRGRREYLDYDVRCALNPVIIDDSASRRGDHYDVGLDALSGGREFHSDGSVEHFAVSVTIVRELLDVMPGDL